MSRGIDTGSHPRRKVNRDAFQGTGEAQPVSREPWNDAVSHAYLDEIPHPAGEPEHEPDWEDIHNQRLERRRPDGDVW